MRQPPPSGEKWQAFFGASISRLSGAQIAVLTCLIDHANPRTGRCDPSQDAIAYELGLPLRTVERAISALLKSGHLQRQRRGDATNSYRINWQALMDLQSGYASRRSIRQLWRVGTDKGGGSVPTKAAGRYPTKAAEET